MALYLGLSLVIRGRKETAMVMTAGSPLLETSGRVTDDDVRRERPARRLGSHAVAARLLPRQRLKKGAGPAEETRQAGDQGCCGVEVRGFEPLASSVRASWR